jgi:hypothetical protein
MNHGMWPVSLVGILSTAVVCGTDMFFLTVGRPALRLASSSAGTEVMGFLHMLKAGGLFLPSPLGALLYRCHRVIIGGHR